MSESRWIVPAALKLDYVTYEEMLEMSASGAKVMALRSVEFARSYGVRLRVRSTFGITSDMKGCPPKPGKTVISSTRSSRSR